MCSPPYPTAGAVVFSGKGRGRGDLLAAVHAHKGRCHDKAERILTEGRGGPWHELQDHVGEPVEGTGMNLAAMLGRELDRVDLAGSEEEAEVKRRLAELAAYMQEREIESPLLGRIIVAIGKG